MKVKGLAFKVKEYAFLRQPQTPLPNSRIDKNYLINTKMIMRWLQMKL